MWAGICALTLALALTSGAATGFAGPRAGASGGAPSAEAEPMFALVSSFDAYQDAGRVVVRWETAGEVGTVGFYLWRLNPATGEFEQVNGELLPALLGSPEGGTYRFVDAAAIPGESYTYRLLEIQHRGGERAHGPFTVDTGKRDAAAEPMSGTYDMRPYPYARRPAREAPRMPKDRQDGRQTPDSFNIRLSRLAVPQPRVRVVTREAGLVYLSAPALAALLGESTETMQGWIEQGNLAASTQGQAIACMPAEDNEGVYFYTETIDSRYTNRNVYWVEEGAGLAMSRVEGQGPAPVGSAQVFTQTAHFEEDKSAQTALAESPDDDYWFWESVVAGVSDFDRRSLPFRTDGVAAEGTATLTVYLQGGTDTPTDPDHHVVLTLNGTEIGEAWWNGFETYDLVVDVPAAALLDGENTLEVKGLRDTGAAHSVFYVDSLDVAYPRHYRAVGDSLLFHGGGHAVVTVEGFSSPDISVLDVTNPREPVVVAATTVDEGDGDYRVTLAPASPDAQYLALTMTALAAPESVVADMPSGLTEVLSAADYLVIAPQQLLAAAQSLADYRASKGLKTMVVDLQDVYDDFNYGIASPEAIKTFLSYAYQNWRRAPKYVVLAGNGTYDYKDNWGRGDNLLPPLMVSTPYGLFASDTRLADVVGDDGVPEMAIGRLPVVSASQLQAMVGKIMAYDAAPGGEWEGRVMMVADNADEAGDFPADSDAVAALVPPEYAVDKIYLSSDNFAATRSALLQGINNGALLLNYIGHAGWNRLADEGLLVNADVPGLTNGARLPMVVGMTCTAGRFELPGRDVLSEALLLHEGGGAVAVWSPTGLSLSPLAKVLDEAFFRAVFWHRRNVVGDAVVAALQVYASQGLPPFMLDIYNLLGDPATELRTEG